MGYLTALVVGTGLLMTPAATVAPGGISLLSGLFTATSALSVTGLVVLDTGQDFTFFGQIVILSLIQVGGLGVLPGHGFHGLVQLALARNARAP